MPTKLIEVVRILFRALRKSPSTVFYFGFKRFRLALFRVFGYWDRLAARSVSEWDEERANQWLKEYRAGNLLIGPEQVNGFKSWVKEQPDWLRALSDRVEATQQGRFTVFDQVHTFDLMDLPWVRDWRYDFTWPKDYFLNYRFYEQNKVDPYDVKYPWELSRMGFLLPLAQMAVLTGDTSFIEFIVDDWDQKNPLGYSINWEPMTCAIHGISLSLALLMIAGNPATPISLVQKILRQIALQGEFLSKNVEHSVVHHNHYSSNLTGLMMMGFTLRKVYSPAKKWFEYAVRKVSKEIRDQFYEDGVNFEKSISYHRLVTEFFLLNLVIMDKAGERIDAEARARMEQACIYIFCYMRADGLAPNLGDNDSAWLISLDPWPTRDHSSLVSFASAYFNNSLIKSSQLRQSSMIVWLLGEQGVNLFQSIACNGDQGFGRFFEMGGMLTSRSGKNSLIADFGEVGNHGSGGHGHNDTFSFELVLGGYPVIEDAGSPTYTGDIKQMMLYASTSHHNTLQVDGKEIARMPGTWRITDEAHPYNVHVSIGDRVDVITGEHAGFSRLADPVRHRRKITFDRFLGKLSCHDSLLCNGKHSVERFLWFNRNILPVLSDNSVCAKLPDGRFVQLTWNAASKGRLEPRLISGVFGSIEDTFCLILSEEIIGQAELEFQILLEPEAN